MGQTNSNGTTVSLADDPIQLVPPSVTASPPRYDLDGNLLFDGRWSYSWDGENRLVKMVSAAWTQPAGGYLANATFPAVTLEFTYDGLSRRVQKKTITSGTAVMEGYLYDGWNVVMISNLNPANGAPLARKWSCVWRPDIGSRLYARGSWQQAGGVGGLAWMQTGIAQTVSMFSYTEVSGNGEVHIPMMDHLGNVRHYYQIKTTASAGPSPSSVTGQVSANLDYDAFGREVRATGSKTPAANPPPGLAANDPWVDNLPFHFSTKFTDRESGLNYYGYRFYDPIDGRWLNRDPIEEWGGAALYAFPGNNPLNLFDILGLLGRPERHHWFPRDNKRTRNPLLAKCPGLDIDLFTTTYTAGTGHQDGAHNVLHDGYNEMVLPIINSITDCCALLLIMEQIMTLSNEYLRNAQTRGAVYNESPIQPGRPPLEDYFNGTSTDAVYNKLKEEYCRCNREKAEQIAATAMARIKTFFAIKNTALSRSHPIEEINTAPPPSLPQPPMEMKERVLHRLTLLLEHPWIGGEAGVARSIQRQPNKLPSREPGSVSRRTPLNSVR